jgi:hypothetical protein
LNRKKELREDINPLIDAVVHVDEAGGVRRTQRVFRREQREAEKAERANPAGLVESRLLEEHDDVFAIHLLSILEQLDEGALGALAVATGWDFHVQSAAVTNEDGLPDASQTVGQLELETNGDLVLLAFLVQKGRWLDCPCTVPICAASSAGNIKYTASVPDPG